MTSCQSSMKSHKFVISKLPWKTNFANATSSIMLIGFEPCRVQATENECTASEGSAWYLITRLEEMPLAWSEDFCKNSKSFSWPQGVWSACGLLWASKQAPRSPVHVKAVRSHLQIHRLHAERGRTSPSQKRHEEMVWRILSWYSFQQYLLKHFLAHSRSFISDCCIESSKGLK